VILDGRLRVPVTAAVLPAAGGARTLVVGAVGAPASRAAALRNAGAEVVLLPARAGRIDIERLLQVLAEREVQSLLVEGGGQVLASFMAAGLVDRIAFFYAPKLLGGGIPLVGGVAESAGAGGGGRPVARALALGPLRVRRVGTDLLVRADVRATPVV
jgi:diaminohydroxyphosphoribosylaminopyrimidine deaminase/5-amino-6-(5-phosphoribosylamino)uracil reductase